MRKSDLVWSISAKIDELVNSYRVTGSKSLIVPNVVELDSISHTSEEHIMRKTLVIASHLTESKGIQLAIEAMRSIIDKIPDAKLLIVGSGPYQSTLKEMTSRRQLEHCVEFLGVMSHQDLSRLLPRCGIGLAPYTNDPNNITVFADPTKLKEYLAAGLPVITTVAPAFSEVIRKNECGMVVNYERSELAEAAVRLLSDDLLFWSCKKRATALGSEFDSKIIYKKAFDDSYTSLAGTRQVWHVSTVGDTQYSTQRRIFDREYDQLGEYQLENWRMSYLVRIFSSLRIRGNSETPNDRFLDVGVGGTGYTVIEAAKNGFHSVGTDLSHVGMQKAHSFAKRILGTRRAELCAFVTCSAEYLPFRNQSFTKVCCIAVLEHVPHDQTAILEIHRTMRAGGRVFISVPNAYDHIFPIFHFAYKHFIDEKVGHLRHYDANHLGSKLHNGGFDVRESYTHANFPKILQHLLTVIFPTLLKRTSKVWWALENFDFRMGGLNSGLNLSICAEKMS
jgi:ubiquinone/menaquinone biosynthesis C-methylase UbiE